MNEQMCTSQENSTFPCCDTLNEILAKFEEMDINDLTMIFEYLVDLINYKKEQKRLNKKPSKQKENLTTNSQAKPINARSADTRQ